LYFTDLGRRDCGDWKRGKKGLNWRKANVEGMREKLDGEDSNRIMRGISVEEAWPHLKNKIQGAIDRHVPKFKSHRKPRPA
jgi:hypothetical protein